MIKNIKYQFSIKKIGFNNGDYLENVMEFIPNIIVDVEFDDCTINSIEIFYTRSGFMTELITGKISSIKSTELDRFLNNSNLFIHSFNNFLYQTQTQIKCGEIVVEKNKI